MKTNCSPSRELYEYIDNSEYISIISDEEVKMNIIQNYLIQCLDFFPNLKFNDFYAYVIISYYFGFNTKLKSARKIN